jgi:hypothetical protein
MSHPQFPRDATDREIQAVQQLHHVADHRRVPDIREALSGAVELIEERGATPRVLGSGGRRPGRGSSIGMANRVSREGIGGIDRAVNFSSGIARGPVNG